MSELKACWMCGKPAFVSHELTYTDMVTCTNILCPNFRQGTEYADWQWRPIEDALRAQLTTAIDGIKWIRDLFVENGEYNEATEKCNELLKELEAKK
jgi:hypothetical protein